MINYMCIYAIDVEKIIIAVFISHLLVVAVGGSCGSSKGHKFCSHNLYIIRIYLQHS